MSRTLALILGFLLSVAHAFATFCAWAVVPGNTANGQGSTFGWRILAFPIFYIVPEATSTRYFWDLFLINSILWGFGLTMLLSAMIRKIKSHGNTPTGA